MDMGKIYKDNKGFTLVELIVAIAIFTIVSGIAISIFISAQNINSSINEDVDKQNIMSELVFRLRTELANAEEVAMVDTPSDGNYSAILADTSWNYIYCGPTGGLTIVENSPLSVTTTLHTVSGLGDKKAYFSFKTQNARLEGGCYELVCDARLFNYDSTDAASPLVADNGGTLLEMIPGFDMSESVYSMNTILTFQNAEYIQAAVEGNRTRIIKYRLPNY